MSKNFTNIQSDVISRAKIDPSDTVSIGLIMSDANDGCSIIAGMRRWPELMKSNTLSLLLADGDKDYNLQSDVDKVEIMAITVPTNYAITLPYVERKNILNIVVQKPIGGTAQPTAWYYDTPTISSDNVSTKTISFNVMPDQAYTVKYFYKALPPQITAGSNFPFFNANYHWIIDFYCLWKYAERNPDPTLDPAYFRGEWEEGMRQLMANVQDYDVVTSMVIPGPARVSSTVQVPPIR